MLKSFNDNEEFCPIHLINHHFFNGNDFKCECPKCKSDNFILWKQMTISQKYKAFKLFDEMCKKEAKGE